MNESTEAILFAAGRGSRLKLEEGMPKPLALLHGKALIDYPISALNSAGFTTENITTVVGYGYELLERHLNGASKTVMQPGQRGNGDALLRAFDTLALDRNTLLTINADDAVFFSAENYAAFLSFHTQKKALITMMLTPHYLPGTHRQQHILDSEERVIAITKPELGFGGYFNGVLALDRAFVEQQRPLLEPEENKESPVTALFNPAMEARRLFGFFHQGKWMGINTQESLARAAQLFDQTSI